MRRTVLLPLLALGTHCARAVVAAPAPVAVPVARFSVSGGPPEGMKRRIASMQPDSSNCALMAQFTGEARPRDGMLEVLLSSGSVTITRSNDKRWDDLHLRVLTSSRAGALGATDDGIRVVLTPTVDSAGPSVTTWQSSDTIRLIFPWQRSLAQRWLVFAVAYHSITYDGRFTECATQAGTAKLVFSDAANPQ